MILAPQCWTMLGKATTARYLLTDRPAVASLIQSWAMHQIKVLIDLYCYVIVVLLWQDKCSMKIYFGYLNIQIYKIRYNKIDI